MSDAGVEDIEDMLDDVEQSSKEYAVANLLGEHPDPVEFEEMMEMVEEIDDDIQGILDKYGVPESGRLSGLLTVQLLSIAVSERDESN